jgi:hypothetical protein
LAYIQTGKLKIFPSTLCNFKNPYKFATALEQSGTVAQLVEHRTENPGVGGSIPPRTTKKQL